MKWISFLQTIGIVALGAIVSLQHARADAPPSYRQQHPIAWMHNLPTGEQPGWSEPWWFNFELSNGNTWNSPLIMNDLKTGSQYEYFADYEEAHAILEIGKSLGNYLSLAIEIPYAYRSGGTMDSAIDSFHVLIGNRRYNRNYYAKNQNIFSVKTDGTEYFTEDPYEGGISNVSLKFKFWFLKWLGQKPSSCLCGIAISSRTKFPTQDEKLGGTTGNIDQSLLLHMGVPLFTASSLWFTAGYTLLGDNPAFKDWPTNNHIIMYELNMDFSIAEKWGLLLSARAESPFLKRDQLEYFDLAADPTTRARNRAASGWNSLVYWRGTQALGIRYSTGANNTIQFLIAEDWGIGAHDTRDNLYSTNAPDVNFIIQSQF